MAALVFPGAASAACGGVNHFWPTDTRGSGRPPLAIGDSVMLGAVGPLRSSGFEVDVRGCRQMSEGLGILRARKRADTLPAKVVIALGTNWTVTLPQIRSALVILGKDRVLGLVTPREVGGVASSDQRAMRQAGKRWPRRAKVLDWVRYSAGHYEWFWDGLHLQPTGARALAKLMRQAHEWPLPRVEAEITPEDVNARPAWRKHAPLG